MRLDHLLSKEHLQQDFWFCLPEPLSGHTFPGGQLMGGTLRLAAGNVVISEYATFGWKESGWWGSRGACTLLGPEGSDAWPGTVG